MESRKIWRIKRTLSVSMACMPPLGLRYEFVKVLYIAPLVDGEPIHWVETACTPPKKQRTSGLCEEVGKSPEGATTLAQSFPRRKCRRPALANLGSHAAPRGRSWQKEHNESQL